MQAPARGPDEGEWVAIKGGEAWEHTRWLGAAELERLLERELERSRVRTLDLQGKSRSEQVKAVLAAPGWYWR